MTGIFLALLGGKVTVTDQFFEYVTLLLPGNGTNGAQNNTFLDGSTNNFTITRNGNTTQGTFSPFSQTGWGNYFNGSSYISSTGFNFSTSNFTIEFFINTNSLAAGPQPISGYTTSGLNYAITLGTGGIWRFYLSSNGSSWDIASEVVLGTATVGKWHHIAIVRSGNSFRGYLDGNGGTLITNSAGIYNNSTGFYIGAAGSVGGNLTGYFSNLRVLLGTAAYDPALSNIDVPTAPFATGTTNQVLLTCQANRFVDSNTATTAKTITRNGSPTVVAFSPFNPTASWSAATYGGSGYFDGNGDYLTVASNAAFALPSNFTWEAWVYRTGTTDDTLYTTNATNGFIVYIDSSNKAIVRQFGVANLITSSGNVPANAWTHIAVARSGTTLSLWINGSRTDGGTTTNSTSFAQGGLYICSSEAITNLHDGYLSNLRLVKGTAVYDPTQTSIPVPTAPFTNDANTSLLLNFTNAGIYDATSKNDLETLADAKISTAVANPFGASTGSMAFDGTGDSLMVPYIPLLEFGSGDFTIELWFRSSSIATYQGLVARRSGAVVGGFVLSLFSSNIAFNAGDTNTSGWEVGITGTSGLSSNTWYHCAVTRQSSVYRVFINGTQAGSSVTWAGTIAYETQPLYIGSEQSGANPLNGYLQDVRITKGIARYTSNFTATTAAFPTL